MDCKVSTTTPVAWTEQTALGSPEQLFSSFAGSCQAPFKWDGSGWTSELTVAPPQGKSTLTATVTLDPASARLLTRTPAACPDLLEIDGTANLELPEGKVADQHPFTISASAGMTPVALGFVVEEADFGPWISVQKSNASMTLSMPISVTALGRACSGQVGLQQMTVYSGGGSGGGQGNFASWSDTAGPTD